MPVTPSGDGRPSLDATDVPLEDDDEDTPFAEPTVGLSDDDDNADDDADLDIEEDVEDELTNDELTSDEATAGDETGVQAAAGVVLEGSRPPPPKIRDRAAGTIRASDAAKSAAVTPTRRRRGRTTPKGAPVKAAPKSGRYTHPIPKEQRQSPPWFPWVLLGFLVLGLLTIVLNYVNVLPGGTNNWYLIGGIVLIVVGLFGATFYH